MTAARYKSSNDDNESDYNENKVYLLPKRWDLVGHMLDYFLDHVLDYMLNHMLDYIIIGLVTTAL